MQRATPTHTGASSPFAGTPKELVKERGCHRRNHQRRRAPTQVDRWGHRKERRVEFAEPRVLGQNSLTKEQSEAILTVDRSVEASTDRQSRHTVLSGSRVSDQDTVMEKPSKSILSTQMGNRSGRAPPGRVQRAYSGDCLPCMYDTACLGPVKMSFLVDTGCTHNLLS